MKQPERFGKFNLLGQVAVGGMAEIYKARYADPSAPQMDIAVKRILPSYTEDQGFVTMFKDEGNIALHLKHPNIVQVYEVGEVNNAWYIAMEFIHGTDLRVLSDACEKHNKRFTSTQIARIVCDTAKALDYAHKCTDENGECMNIVHRDCTPHNIMVTYDGQVKLMDFGIAKAASRATKTRVGTVKGKSSYMSPEQARGKNLDGRSDMFTLGTVGWELLTGYRLFKAPDDMKAISKILRDETIHVSDIDSKIPRELGNIIQRTLEKNRDERYPTCGDLAADLEDYLARCGDGSDMHLGLVVQQLLGVNGHNPAEIPSYIPGNAMFVMDDQGNFKLKNEVGPAPMSAPAAPQPYPSQPALAPQPMMQPQMPSPTLGNIPGDPFYGQASSALEPAKPVGILIASAILVLIAIGLGITGFVFYNAESPEKKEFVIPESRVTLKTSPDNASIIVNGQKLDQKTPYTYKTKLGESLNIEFSLDNYESVKVRREARFLTQDVNVKLLTTEEARRASMTSLEKLTINTTPEGATIKINGEDRGPAPVTLRDIKFGEELKIEVAADGYEPKTSVFIASKMSEPETTISLATLANAEKRDTGGVKVVKATPQPAKKKPASSTSSSSGMGSVTVKAKPWAIVSIDGARIGNTPVNKRALKAGSHKIELNHPAKQKKVNKTVTVKADQTVTVNYDFNADKWL